MHKEDDIRYRCPLWGRILSFIMSTVVFTNSIAYYCKVEAVDIQKDEHSVIQEIIVEQTESEVPMKSDEEIVNEVGVGLWGNGEDRKNRLTEAGYDYEEIQSKVNAQHAAKDLLRTSAYHLTGEGLTKRGGVYYNPNTGLKETWYSQRVLPGGGLVIPGRHVNEEGFVCDIDGYICVASSTHPKGTAIETSRGIGKVYDCGCAPGILDLYVDW